MYIYTPPRTPIFLKIINQDTKNITEGQNTKFVITSNSSRVSWLADWEAVVEGVNQNQSLDLLLFSSVTFSGVQLMTL